LRGCNSTHQVFGIRQVSHHGIELWLLVQIFYDNVSQNDQYGINNLIKGKIANLSVEEGWNRIEEYAQDQDNTWDEPDSTMSISKIMQTPSSEDRLWKLHERVSYLTGSRTAKQLSNPYLICDHCGGPPEIEECGGEPTIECAYLSSIDIFDDPSLLTFYQNDDFTPWGNLVRKEEGEKGHDFKIRSTFEDDLGHFTHEKNLQLKGIDELITEQQNDMGKWFQKLNATLNGRNEPQISQKDPLLAITTRAGTTTKDPPYPNQHPIVVEPDIPHREEGDVSDETPEQPPQMTSSPLAPPNQHGIRHEVDACS
jgi:hypothetical protein